MSVMALQRVIGPHAALARTFLLSAGAVIAVLIGLLGMHVLGTGSTHHAPAVITESVHHSGEAATFDITLAGPASVPDQPAAHPCADAACGGDMGAMAFMACVLALLAVSIVLAVRPARIDPASRTLAPPVAAAPPIETPPIPPDLNVLSISRT